MIWIRKKVLALRYTLRLFRRDGSGKRFLCQFDRSAKGPSCGMFCRSKRIIGAILLTSIAILLGFLPVLPGFVFFIAALILLATICRPLAVWLDRCELFLQRLWKRVRQ